MQIKTFYIKTFGCQMNYADSEKINMILMSAGLRKVIDPVKADIIVLNTCSVRQKGEDRVFGFMNEITRYHSKKSNQWSVISDQNGGLERKNQSDNCKLQTANFPLFGITGCMVRKSGMAKRYLPVISTETNEVEKSIQSEADPSQAQDDKQKYKRKNAEKIILLDSSDSLLNYDDELFLRSPLIDFTFRIEEVSLVTKILSLISWEDIGNDAKWNEYLQVKQLQENPASANIIIQTGCDNYCTFCIVPYTRGREVSRLQDEIIAEITEVVQHGTKEVTLLGQNVNSYGKETKKKLWNSEELTWDKSLLLKGGSDEGGRGFPKSIRTWKEDRIWYRQDLAEKANILRKDMTWPEKQLWYEILSGDRLEGVHFLRQKPLLDYIVDFYCDELALVIEIDGESHIGRESYDTKRDEELLNTWVMTVRYTNDEILGNLDWVREDLINIIQERRKILSRYRDSSFQKEPTEQEILRATGNPQSLSRQLLPEGASKTPFRELLEKIDAVEWLDRIRFTSSNPHDMTRDILDAHFDLPKICNYLHFALQSGSNTMLRRMNRKHTYADFKAQVDYLRWRDPLFSISTDIIVGFPWETEEEFQATVTAMHECQFDFAFIARYSPRSGTIATTKYEDDITPEEKARRWTILNDILRVTAKSRNLLMVGREEEILISWEGKDETWVGRTRNFKEVFIRKDTQTQTEDTVENIRIGDIVKVKITESEGWILKGEESLANLIPLPYVEN